MAVNLQLIPAKGMTLPFISYGGSSIISLAYGVGMMLALTRQRPRTEVEIDERGRLSAVTRSAWLTESEPHCLIFDAFLGELVSTPDRRGTLDNAVRRDWRTPSAI